MATDQPNIAENPNDVMRRFLPDMKRLLNIEDLILYLLSENAIGDDDTLKLSVSGQLSKNQVLVNLQQIITTRGTVQQFLLALKASWDDNPGHKELYDMMIAERERRMSVTSHNSAISSRSFPRLSSVTSQSQLIQENYSQSDPSSGTHAVTPAMSATQTVQPPSASPMVVSQEPTTDVRQPQQTIEPETVPNDQQKIKIKYFWIGGLFGGMFTVVIVLVVLAITTIAYGSLGIQGKDVCGFFDVQVGAFDVSSGVLIVLLAVLVILIMFLYTAYSIFLQQHCVLIMLFPVVGLVVVCVLGIIANVLFSFTSVVKVVYADYNSWKPETINCTSPAFYSAFTYVTVEFVILFIIIVFLISIIVWCCRHRCS